ncbi:OLC1v1004644C1 [Oldenlandia corymbosa var. corymbosa]|uniref:RING-type E3 ubiquitin transferase n=1 Tax=Oldenlandia corymbosa var. corymbosa TaxID=529605 RepID=A0AAV1DEU2_OLDCO|nr:OLC1v1004644C1 [Oldenlandia corymbosa var. corymbosa]
MFLYHHDFDFPVVLTAVIWFGLFYCCLKFEGEQSDEPSSGGAAPRIRHQNPHSLPQRLQPFVIPLEPRRQVPGNAAPAIRPEQPESTSARPPLTEIIIDIPEHYDYDNNKNTECAICLESLGSYSSTAVLPGCHHSFHPDCIAVWLAIHRTCPLCRLPAAAAVNRGGKDRGCALCRAFYVPETASPGRPSRRTWDDLPMCGHSFHSNCLDAWLRYSQTCPICNT